MIIPYLLIWVHGLRENSFKKTFEAAAASMSLLSYHKYAITFIR